MRTAVVHLEENSEIGDSFQLQLGLSEIHAPRMIAQQHPLDTNKQVRVNLCQIYEKIIDGN